MAEKNNANCKICGSPYYLCMSCRDSMKLQPWKIYCCSADCYKVFQTVRGLSTGVYTKDEFKSKLKNIDLSNLENYREHIKILIKDTLKEEPVVEPVVETEVDVSTKDEARINVEKPVAYSRKRNLKVEVDAE